MKRRIMNRASFTPKAFGAGKRGYNYEKDIH